MVIKEIRKTLLWAFFAVSLATSGTALAQTEQTDLISDFELTLDESIRMAVANSPQIKRALLSVDDAEELVRIAYGEIYPDITSSVNYTRNMEIPVTYVPGEFFGGAPGSLIPVEFGTDNNWQGGFTVNQTLFRGETIVGLSSATVFRTVQEENLRAVSQQVITQTRLAYYAVLAAYERLRLEEAQVARLEENLAENKSRQAAGLLDSYDVLSIEVQLANQRPALIEAEHGVDEAYRNLKLTMGVPLKFDFSVKGNLNEFDILSPEANAGVNDEIKEIDQMTPFVFQETVLDTSEIVGSRGDLRLIDATIALNDKEETAVKSRFLPELNATYNLQWSAAQAGAPQPFENSNRFQTIGLNLSLPIFQGFKRMADVQRVQIARKDLEEQKREVELFAQNEIASAIEGLNIAFETAEARKIALEQAREGYDRALKRFENGLGSQIEVTDADVQVRQAEVNYALMVYQYLNAKAQYDLATGKVPFVDTVTEE